MKRILICTGLLFAATTLLAQQAPAKKPPVSPPATASATVNGKSITQPLKLTSGDIIEVGDEKVEFLLE